MKEKQLIQAINRRLRGIHHQSMTHSSLSMNGTPDRYYDGPKRDAWIEFKVLDHLPRSGRWCVRPLTGKMKQERGKLTALQYRWLARRHAAGGNAFVIVGIPGRKALILSQPADWVTEVPLALAKPLELVASWIQDYCGGLSDL